MSGVNSTHKHCVRKQGGRGFPERKETLTASQVNSDAGRTQINSLKEGNNTVNDIWGNESVPIKQFAGMTH